MEMFDGNAAQFLALLEALHDSSVRPLQTGMPEEFEVQEVVMELISAGITLLSGRYLHLVYIDLKETVHHTNSIHPFSPFICSSIYHCKSIICTMYWGLLIIQLEIQLQ